LYRYFSKTYNAQIKINGERKEVKNYLVLLRSNEIFSYYDEEYQKKFIKK